MDQEKKEQQEQINPTAFSSDVLYCSDETYEDGDESESQSSCNYKVIEIPFSIFSEQDPFHEDDELTSTLLSKETDQQISGLYRETLEPDPFLSGARREAVDWILRVTAHHSFSALTALLAVNYLDRFILQFDGFRRDQKPWMTELTAVACLSLAAKVEETHVPLLLDLQVEDTSKYMFEARTVQRMEILVLSALQWRMNPVTPFSFLHHISRRFGLKDHICLEFLRRCELTLLSVVSDGRFTLHLPSAMAVATALHVVNSVLAPSVVASEYQNFLLKILKIDKDKVEACLQLVNELVSLSSHGRSRSNKRKFGSAPGSPNGVIDVTFSSDGSNDSWATTSSPSSSSSVTSSPEPSSKKSKNTPTAR